MIDTLINKQDTFEIVRAKVAEILAAESVSQMALATAQSLDPEQWRLNVYEERSNPWEQVLNSPNQRTPIVSVWFDQASADKGMGNVVERQQMVGTINVDCYGFGRSQGNGAGHDPGDRMAALEAQRAVRLCRNILMAATYSYLDLRGVVGQRWVQSITQFQPQLDDQSAIHCVAARIALSVSYNEFSPQVTPTTLETVTADVYRSEDGQLIVQTEYQY